MTTIFIAGDSISQTNAFDTFPQTGLGQGLRIYIKQSVDIRNFARNGRSTKSFIDEGRLERINNEIKPGDFLFIMFSHNDEKKEDPTRYTKPYEDYQGNLKKMCDVALSHKAYPVILTPVARRHFDQAGNLIEGTHMEYPAAAIELAKRLNVPFIDVHKSSIEFLKSVGDEESKRYFMNFGAGLYDNYPDEHIDNTHLRYDGAVKFAGMIADGLHNLGGIYDELLNKKWPEDDSDTQP